MPARKDEMKVAVGLVPLSRIEYLVNDKEAQLPQHLKLPLRHPLIERRPERPKVMVLVYILDLDSLAIDQKPAVGREFDTPDLKRRLVPIDIVSARVEHLLTATYMLGVWVGGRPQSYSVWKATDLDRASFSPAVMSTTARGNSATLS